MVLARRKKVEGIGGRKKMERSEVVGGEGRVGGVGIASAGSVPLW